MLWNARWTFMDRRTWSPGPWDDEPWDTVSWTDPATGLPCLAQRGPLGHWCGYIGLPSTHPWYGRDFRDCGNRQRCPRWCTCGQAPVDLVPVYGGLTFSGPVDATAGWWFGFDCAHAGDQLPAFAPLQSLAVCPVAPPPTYRTLAFVQAQCAALACQFVAIGMAPALPNPLLEHADD